MRHGKKFNHLSRTDSHRKALLSSMATSLIVHKRINTTVAKAKALRIYVEPLLTKSKNDTTHSRRQVFSYLQDKNSVNILFRDVAVKIAERAGGYTRIIKTGTRLGDNAEMCFIELVDYNALYTAKGEIKKAKTTRRGRSSGAKSSSSVEKSKGTVSLTSDPMVSKTDSELDPIASMTSNEKHHLPKSDPLDSSETSSSTATGNLKVSSDELADKQETSEEPSNGLGTNGENSEESSEKYSDEE